MVESRFRRVASALLRVVVACACCLGIWFSWQFARADFLFHRDTGKSVAEAIRLVPDGWEFYMRQAQFDRAHARDLLEKALRLNPYNAQAEIELGLQFESDEDYPDAEKAFLAAYAVDHTYLPRWSLANYYFRQDNMPQFWAWARSAAVMPSDDLGPLFELCWRLNPNPEAISTAILNDKPELIRQYISFLLSKDQLSAVAPVAARLVRHGDEGSDRPLLFAVLNRAVAAGDAPTVRSLWGLLAGSHWVEADATVPQNASFAREPLPVSLDWSLPEYTGLHSWPGASGLETEFTGTQPEDCIIAEQAIVLNPGEYSLQYDDQTTGIAAGTGIHWQVMDPESKQVLASSPDLASDSPHHGSEAFTVPQGAGLLRLSLVYARTLGTPRISGTLVVRSVQINKLP